MLIGFGFGSPLVSLLMLLATSLLSYAIYRAFAAARKPKTREERREALRRYYYEQRQLARRMMREFDLTDEEIEQKIEDELDRR
ncbi:hypothetical protein LLE49_04610 [Alicyclobacillus tolerans]|uniref:hypothetical protein n=1 Tax=Alicyclobacillus tolerans TaxID=90970 RepID=UPI001F461D98|nr:hypothetical protein [Alicyclobacillus tolerans]MCF8564018.1 hypothetical protein [Alicyclobacillus tolerans]